MRLFPAEARARFAAARVARLATVGADGVPHLVPVAFALVGVAGSDDDRDAIAVAVDHKPKGTTRLRRLANVAETGRACLLADHYADDWTRLWWARADCAADVLDAWPEAVAALAGRYPQYAERPPTGPVLRARVTRWSGWAYR